MGAVADIMGRSSFV